MKDDLHLTYDCEMQERNKTLRYKYGKEQRNFFAKILKLNKITKIRKSSSLRVQLRTRALGFAVCSEGLE